MTKDGRGMIRVARMAVLIAVCLRIPVAMAAQVYVDPTAASTPAIPYDTPGSALHSIQEAVDYTSFDDEVILLPGTFLLTEPVRLINKTITVRGENENQRDQTIVDAQGLSRVFTLKISNGSRLKWLTIRNGMAPPIPGVEDSYGGAVYIEDGGNIVECVIEDSVANYGGGVRIWKAGSITNSMIRNNTANVNGGGVHLYAGGTIGDCEIYGNTATEKGGGVHLYDGGEVSTSLIYSNQAAFGGGVRLINISDTAPAVRRSTIFKNRAVRYADYQGMGAGAQLVTGGTLENCLIYDNTVDGDGGGAYLYGAVNIVNCTIADNTTLDTNNDGNGDGRGAGIFTDGGTIRNCILFYNDYNAFSGSAKNYYNKTDTRTPTYVNTLTSPSIGPIAGSPSFLDRAGRNYQLRADSVCIDKGTNAQAPNTDILGAPRPQPGVLNAPTAITDIGAYEYELSLTDFSGIVTYDGWLDGGSPHSSAPIAGNGNPDFRPLWVRVSSAGVILRTQRFDRINEVYTVTNVPTSVPLTVAAYWDLNEDATQQIWEPSGLYSNNPLAIAEGAPATTNVNIQMTDPNTDTDEDGLTDFEETYRYGTDPDLDDTDEDGFSDYNEIHLYGTDPLDPDSFPAIMTGTIAYDGSLGVSTTIVLRATSGTNVWIGVVNPTNGWYVLGVKTKTPLSMRAHLDFDADGQWDAWEPTGVYPTNPPQTMTLSNLITTVDFAMTDPDSDQDGIPDYRERTWSDYASGAISFPEWQQGYGDPTDYDPYLGPSLGGNDLSTNNADTDGDGMSDTWEVDNGLDPVDPADASDDPDGDLLTNLEEWVLGTDPKDPDSDDDGMSDGWEAYYLPFLDPLTPDGHMDIEPDGMASLEEYAYSTNALGMGFDPADGLNPTIEDTDLDGMPDGWEVHFGLDPLDPFDAAVDIEPDGMTNIVEYTYSLNRLGAGFDPAAGLDPTEVDTDGDGMSDFWEWQYIPYLDPLVPDAEADPDTDGRTNLEEYFDGTNPTNSDTDGDGASDGEEFLAGTDPLDPSSYPVSISGTLTYTGIQTGVYYVAASQFPSGTVYWTTADTNGDYVISNTANATNYTVNAFLDTDGNATQDTWEAFGTLSDTNGAPVILFLTNQVTGADITLEDSNEDTDLDDLTDYEERFVYFTELDNDDTDDDGMPDGWEVAHGLDPLDPTDWNLNPDDDDLHNLDEFFSLTDPNDPDSDDDGLNDGEEVLTYFTDPNDPDSDDDGLDDYEEVHTYFTDPNDPDSDNDGFGDGLEVQVGTIPLDPLSFPAVISGLITYVGTQTGMIHVAAVDADTNRYETVLAAPGAYALTNMPTLKTYTLAAYLDTDGDLEVDTWEAQVVYTNSPFVLATNLPDADMTLEHPTVDSDQDGLSDFDEVIVHHTDPNDPDSDDDGMPDGWEVYFGLDPNSDDAGDDTEPDGMTHLAEYAYSTNALGGTGFDPADGLDPTEADTDGDGMPDGWEVYFGLDPLDPADAGDNPDGDGMTHLEEYTYSLNRLGAGFDPADGLDPTNDDTDGDGVNDGDEIAAGSDPLDRESFPITLSGTITYGGTQTGTVFLVTESVAGSISNALTMTGTSVVYSVSNLIAKTDYTVWAFRDSTGDGLTNAWEAAGAYAGNPILAPTGTLTDVDVVLTDPLTDSDQDGLTDYDEIYLHHTDPNDPDSDDDEMPDGWEVHFGLDPNLDDAGDDTDTDGMTHLEEYTYSLNRLGAGFDPADGLDPTDDDTDGDGMPDGWEVHFGLDPLDPTNGGVDDEEPDGMTSLEEYTYSTNALGGTGFNPADGLDPTKADTDGDGMPDGWEVYFGLDPLDPTNAGVDDEEPDGMTSLEEYAYSTNRLGAGFDPADGLDPTEADTDTDGANDGDERQWGSDPLNRDSFPATISGTILNATALPQTGTVYVVFNLESNANPFAAFNIGAVTNGGAHPFAVQYVPTMTSYWISAYMDLNGDGSNNTWEPFGAAYNGTNAVAPTNDLNVGLIPLDDSMRDSDEDGLTDFDEVTVHGTDPEKADTDGDSFNDYDEIFVYGSDPTNSLSFPAYIGGILNYAGTQTGPLLLTVTNETDAFLYDLGAYTNGPYSTPTNLLTLTNYVVEAFIDANTNGVLDLWEARGAPAGSPFLLATNVTDADITLEDPTADSDQDGLTDYDEYYIHGTDPEDPDSDDDGMPDGWEVHFGLDPLDPSDAAVDEEPDGMTSLEEYNYSTNVLGMGFDPADGLDPTNDDTDGDGLTDGDEVNLYGSDPLEPDSDDDGMPDGWEVEFMPDLDPMADDAGNDPDGDGMTNLEEYNYSLNRLGVGFDPADGLDPTDDDTDGDGLTDGDEVNLYGTDPLDPDSDGDGFDDADEILNIGSDPMNDADPVVVDDDAPNDPSPNNPFDPYPDEDGSLENPYDSIQEGVDRAQDGQVVLVMDGLYNGVGNNNINTLNKAITIRSRNGYETASILTDNGNVFIVNSGEGTNTVIQGFTIRTSVLDLGSAGIHVDGSSPLIRECRFFDCGEAGVRVVNAGSPHIVDCLFEENQGAIKIESSHPRVERCTMRFNEDEFGGGLWITGTSVTTSMPVIVNCLIVRNRADVGAGVYAGAHTRAVFVNNTIADNIADTRGGGIYNAGETKFWNGILWGNSAPSGPGFSLDKAFETSYSCMQTPRSTSVGVFTNNPRFAASNDYTIISSSPCIDKGSGSIPYAGASAPNVDIRQLPRPVIVSQFPGYDVGAYEYQPGGALFIQSPGGSVGQVLDSGLPQTVNWTYDGTVGTNLTLAYTDQFLADPTLTWTTISSNIFRGNGGSGRYVWTAPVTNTARMFLRLSDATNSLVTGISTFSFGITNGIQVYTPTNDATFYLGQTLAVAWASSPATNTTAQWAFSTDGVSYDPGDGAVLTNVAHTSGGATNTGGWVLDGTAFLTTNGRLRVSSGGLRPGLSGGGISVLGLAITNPGMGAEVQTGMTINVNWTGLGAGPLVNIRYSDDGGGSFGTVSNEVNNADGTNSFSWTVPAATTSNAVLEVASASDSNIIAWVSFEVSDAGGSSVNLAGDGIPDVWKISMGLDPENRDGLSGADDDPDEDGSSNRHEWQAGTDPLDGESWFGIISLGGESGGDPEPASSGPTLRWKTVAGRRYVVETAPSPAGPWLAASEEREASGGDMVWTDDPPVADRRYYRVRVLAE